MSRDRRNRLWWSSLFVGETNSPPVRLSPKDHLNASTFWHFYSMTVNSLAQWLIANDFIFSSFPYFFCIKEEPLGYHNNNITELGSNR